MVFAIERKSSLIQLSRFSQARDRSILNPNHSLTGTTMYMATTLEGRLTSIYLNPSLALASVLLDFLAQPFLTHYL